jgi:triosephosphate isomerase
MSKIIIANWKENPKTLDEANKIIKKTFEIMQTGEVQHDILLSVPSIFFGFIKADVEKNNQILNKGIFKKIKNIFTNKKEVLLGVQDVFWAEEGAYTGKYGASMLKSVNADFSIVGHSETRENENNKKGYTDEEINLKIHNLLKFKMKIVLCVGENKREGDWKKEIAEQLAKNLNGVFKEELSNIIFAYEPVWAIGKNAERAATNEEIVESVDFIRFYLENHFGRGSGDVKVVYGGSVDEKNIKEILNIKSIDGILAGRASADTDKWEKLLRNSK